MLALLTSLIVSATPCEALEDATRLAQAARDQGALNQAAALLPGPLAERVRGEVGRTGVDGALVLLERSTSLSCPATSTSTSLDPARLRSLVAQDGRFLGVRADDVSGRLLDRLMALLERLLESEGMQRFSEHTRTIYVTLLCMVCGFVAVRVWRRSRITARPVVDNGVVIGVERHRAAAFSALRDEARAALEGAPREALLLLRRALLARIGEHDEGAVRPSRTTSEILARLEGRVAAVVGLPLQHFDVAFYGGDDSVEAARALLAEVDAAVAALGPSLAGRGQR